MYHQITPAPDPGFRKYAMAPRRFAQQMRVLALTGHHAISIEALLAARGGGTQLPRRPVVITFDDGFQDTFDHAVPVLQSHGFTATFYLVSDLVGRRARWLEVERGLSLGLFDWATARQLVSLGFSVGSHSRTHPRLASLGSSAIRSELGESRQTIEQHLGQAVRDLAYPHGSYDERVVQIATESGYRSACSVRIGRSAASDEKMALHRIPVGGHEPLPTFLWRLRWGASPREWARARRPSLR